MKNIPIVFMHYGDSDYLTHSLSQAKLTNPKSEIILIGDKANRKYSFVSNLNICDFGESIKDISKIYVHLSPNRYHYSLFNIQRWFILRDFMKKNKLSRCFYQDSDVLLFGDVSEKKEFEHAYCSSSGHSSINSPRGLEKFCAFILEKYSDHLFVEKMKKTFIESGNKSNLGDMYFLKLYANQFPERVHNLCNIDKNAMFDSNIKHPNSFESHQGWKKIYLIQGIPHLKTLVGAQFIRLYSIHFQGSTKQYMKYFTNLQHENRFLFFDYERKHWVNAN